MPAVPLRVQLKYYLGALGAMTLPISIHKDTLTTDSNGFPYSHVHTKQRHEKNRLLEHCVSLFTLNYVISYLL